jgi:hypothetical protein
VAIRDEETGMVALKSVDTIHDFILQERARSAT